MSSVRKTFSREQMNQEIGRFVEYLLDTETTSEVSYNQTMLEKDDLYDECYLPSFEKVGHQKLQQWSEFYQHQHVDLIEQMEANDESDPSDEASENESEEEDDDDKEGSSPTQSPEKGKIPQTTKSSDVHIDPVGQCKRFLQFLYHCQQDHTHFVDLYFRILDQCILNGNEQIRGIALQQIALHLSDGVVDQNERRRLVKYLPSKKSTTAIPAIHEPVLATIQTLLSTNKAEVSTMSSDDLDILYPCHARFLDLRREFRDSTHYFIDGDSLLLSFAHHINVNLVAYGGNTLHVMFLIERILLALFNQTHQCNYTLLFFDCHHQFYQEEKAILSLIRSCLIAHLSHNTGKYGSPRVQQFSSWLDPKYKKFAQNEKPHFVFYHDMLSLDVTKHPLLSKNALEQLRYIYRLFGIYHQFHLEYHLYLMNRLVLTDICVKGFQVKFTNNCSKRRLQQAVQVRASYRLAIVTEKNGWIEFEQKIDEQIRQGDVRLVLYVKTIVELIENRSDPSEEHVVFDLLYPLLLLHVALLMRLSLTDRHLSSECPPLTFSPVMSQLIDQFQSHLALSVSACSSLRSWSKIADLFDGRLFAFTLHQLNQSSSKMQFDSNTMEVVKECLSFCKLPSDENLFRDAVAQLVLANHLLLPTAPSGETAVVKNKRPKITRISNPFIDHYLQPILRRADELSFDFVHPQEILLARYEGKHHWHVFKEVGDEISRIRDNDEQNRRSAKHRYRTTNQQKFYAYFTLYGNSLTSRDVQDNHLQIVLPASTAATESASAASDGKKEKGQKKGKEVPQKKADKIREEHKQQKLIKQTENESEQRMTIESALRQIPSDDYPQAIELIEQSLPKFETSTHRLELQKQKFRLQRKYLQLLRKRNTSAGEEQSKIELLQVSFFATLTEMVHLEKTIDAFDTKRKYLEELMNDSALDREKWYRFQMEKINSRLPRREQGVPDKRVLDFIPDDWQVKFLDAVDKRQSIIIVAPTASGKTYASYYAMNKVLKDGHEPHGICVYIAPTKALVNQVAATIHSKFGPVFGIFTRDYRMNMDSCRILVTVPQCMEILLLSPSHQRWCQQIKYAIFDEIHCMSGEIGADVWEKTMLLINCPMIGLSATVNNSEELCQWITNVEKQRSKLFKTSKPRQVCLIIHHERVADLNKYLYSDGQLHPVHPVGVMNAKQLITRGVPKDFSLSPRETLQLNDALNISAVNHQSTILSDTELQPVPTLAEYFSPEWIIERNVCNAYSQLVSHRFKHLIEQKATSAIESITASLQPITSKEVKYPESKPAASLIIDFIKTLREKNLLPCIVFSDNRKLCEKMAASIAEHFQDVESQLRSTKYKAKIEELNKRLELAEQTRKKTKAKKAPKSSRKRDHDQDNIVELQMVEEEESNQIILSGHEQQLLDGILDEGTLANRQGCNVELVDALLKRADSVNRQLVEYMKRGVAYHHAGVNNRGRVAVEALFRNRYVQVVFSTATLALGIHMPTKTVAFLNDSIYLDALQYRQSSGRAGRRGFDIQGHVVFIDIPLAKIRHLMISAIPDIHAHFLTSVTFLMRLFHLCSNAKDSTDAINRSLVVLQCPLLAQSPIRHPMIDLQTRYHCLFTCDFLYRLNLINGQGHLIGLAGLLSHLHYFEPANILLIYLMDTRLFHRVTDQLEIITVFAYLFTNLPWLITRRTHAQLTGGRKEGKLNSKLFLPPISKEFRQRVNAYNAIVKEIYGCYIDAVARSLRATGDRQEEVLPFTNVSFAESSDYDHGTFEYRLHHHHSQQAQNPSISPFAALSGLTHEQFMSNYNAIVGSWDLAYDLDLSSRVVPFVDIDSCDHTNTAYYLNSYALDFFKHGSETLLIMENGLNAGDTYSLLLDFQLILSSIKTSLEVIIARETKDDRNEDWRILAPLYRSLSSVQNRFSAKFYRQYGGRNQI